MYNSGVLIDRMKCKLLVNLQVKGLLCRIKADHPEKRSSITSLQHVLCSLVPDCSSPVPLSYSRAASKSHFNPSPPFSSHHQPPLTTSAPATTLLSVPSSIPAKVPHRSLTLNTSIHISLLSSTTKLLTTAGPLQDTTPVQASCTIGIHPALWSQKHQLSCLPDPAPMRSHLSCQNLYPLPEQGLRCLPLIYHPVPHHAPPPAPLSSHLLLHTVALNALVHLLSPRKSSWQTWTGCLQTADHSKEVHYSVTVFLSSSIIEIHFICCAYRPGMADSGANTNSPKLQ